MTKTILLATTAILFTGGVAAAQTSSDGPDPQVAQAPVPTGPTSQAPQIDAAQQGVLVFTPDFFADQRPNTALDMVGRVPGFSIEDGDGSRGFEGAVGNILINNTRPASKNDTGSSVLSRTPASQVERIELIRGGAPGIAMQGFSVVVNVILKTEASHQSVVTFSANIFEGARDLFAGSYQYTTREGDRSWSVLLSDGISMSDSGGLGRVVRRDAQGNIVRDEAFEQIFYGGGQSVRGNWSGPAAGGKLELTGRIGQNDFNQEIVQESAAVLREIASANENQSGEVGVVYSRPLSQAWKLETRFIHNFNDFSNASESLVTTGGVPGAERLFTTDGKSSETIGRVLFRNERSASTTFETGGEVAYNMLDTSQAFTIGGAPVPLPSASVKVEEIRGELFGKGTWRLSPTLTVESGVRLEGSTISQSGDADQEKTLFFIKPRVLGTWTPGEANQVRLRLEREVGQLDFGDFAASADLQNGNVFGGNVDLEPEQRWTAELVYERRFWGEGVISTTLRHQKIEDVIDRLPLTGGLSATGNIGDGSQTTAAVSLTLPTDRLGVSGGRLRTTATWNESEVTDPTTGESREISRVRPFDMNIGFTQDIVSLKTQWGFEWLRGFDEPTFHPDETFDVRLRDYRVLFVEYKPKSDLSIRAQVNIWDDFLITRTGYADRSVARPVAFVETREVDPRTFYQVRLRKTF